MSFPGTTPRYSPDNRLDFHEEIGRCRGHGKGLNVEEGGAMRVGFLDGFSHERSRRMRKGIAVAIAAALVLLMGAATGNALAADTIIIRVATGTAPDHPENVGANKFKEILEKKSNGRVEVRVHPAGQLGSQRDFV